MAIREELIPVVRERLWNRALYRDTGCIEFLGASVSGYGSLRIQGRSRLTHRLMWEVEHGPIPADKNVLHKCDNRPCINTDHLYLGTQSDNMRDRHARKPETTVRGEQVKTGKLTEIEVLHIRALYDTGHYSTYHIQRRWYPRVSPRSIASIISRETWKHI